MQGFVDSAAVELLTGNGRGGYTFNGEFGEQLNRVNFDIGLLRPYIAEDGRRYCDMQTNDPVTNEQGAIVYNKATGTPLYKRRPVPLSELISNGLASPTANASALPRLAWERIDRAVLRATRDPLIAWQDLANANTYGGFDGMSVFALTRDTMTDPGQAQVDMDGLTDALGDAPLFNPDTLPLPITHCGFYLSQRQLAVSRNSGMPLDTTLAEAAGRRVSEMIEKMTIGVTDFSGLAGGDPSTAFTNRGVYGYITHPDRITYATLNAPALGTPHNTFNDVNALIQTAIGKGFYGPYMLYYTRNFHQYMISDYFNTTTSGAVAPTKTLIQRIKEIDGIKDVKMLPFWYSATNAVASTSSLLLIQHGESCRAVNGLAPVTVQWESRGGAQINFRVMCIQVPDIRSQFVRLSTSTTAQTGRAAPIVHATTS